MRKVLILANHDVVVYNFRRELIERLIADGYEVYISLPYGPRIDNLVSIGCKFIETAIDRRGANPLTDLRLMLFYRKLIKKIKPNIVLTYTIKPNIYGGMMCRFLKTPYLCNITGLGTAVENKGIMQKFTLALYRIALKKAQQVFFQNQENLDFLLHNKTIKCDYTLLPGSGVNLTEFSPLPYEESETVNFLFVSRILKEKGIDHYLDAAQAIKKEHPNTRFIIIGFCEQEYDRTRMDKLHQAGAVEYFGMQSDTKRFYSRAHCMVHPSYYPEGVSNALLEAAACARPIISTDRSGCRDVIDNSINGYIVQPMDSEDLMKKIRMFLALSHAERRTMGLEGRRKMECEFDRSIVVNAYMDEIKAVEWHKESF